MYVKLYKYRLNCNGQTQSDNTKEEWKNIKQTRQQRNEKTGENRRTRVTGLSPAAPEYQNTKMFAPIAPFQAKIYATSSLS